MATARGDNRMGKISRHWEVFIRSTIGKRVTFLMLLDEQGKDAFFSSINVCCFH